MTKKEFNQFIYRRVSEQKYGKYDQLLIYISGHGDRDDNCLGYLVMSDSDDPQNDYTRDSYVSYADLTAKLKASKCEHILLMVDACHSGTFDEDVAFLTKGGEASTKELVSKSLQFPTKFFLTSGGQELVSDGQPGNNSPFALEILNAFSTKGGDDEMLTLTEIQTYLEMKN